MDYHIYLHNAYGKSTTTSRATKPQTPEKFGIIKNKVEDDNEDNEKSLLGMVRHFPKTTATIVMIKKIYSLTSKAIDLYYSYYTTNSGDYIQQRKWGNMKQAMNLIKNPISSAVSISRNNLAIDRENERKEMESQLLGGTLIGGNYGRYL